MQVVADDFEHAEPAFLEERYPIDVIITNLDDEDLEFDVDVLMQPTEDETGKLRDPFGAMIGG